MKYFVLFCLIVIILIVLYKLVSSSSTNKIEGFDSNGNASDLLTRYKSSDSQSKAVSDSSDLELSINPWTNKLYNLQNAHQQLKPIGLYKPHLTIKGEKYTKLGDMISQHTDYSLPDATEFTLLIKKQVSDIKPPTDYNLIIKFGNPNIPVFYNKFEGFITSYNDLGAIVNSVSNCLQAVSNLNGVLATNGNRLENILKQVVGNNANFQVGNSAPLSVYSLMNLPVNKLNNSIISTPISPTTSITIPLGTNITIQKSDNSTTKFTFDNINITQPLTKSSVLKSLSNQNLNINENNIKIKKTSINLFAFVKVETIITYLQKICTDIMNILGEPGINPDFISYLNLADSWQGVNILLSALSTIENKTTENDPTKLGININDYTNPISNNDVLKGYANSNNNTLLGSILNIIINYTIYYNYPTITLTPNNLGAANANILMVGEFNKSIFNYTNFIITQNDPNVKTITYKIIPNLSELLNFQTALNSNTLDFFPLEIYEPVAPKGYVSLGHVFCNLTKDLTKIKTMNNVACVPVQCVKEIRDWQTTDKVFEYNLNNIYWALYKNPYTGTFIAVNQPQMPKGKVCKVIACVAKCTAVEELKKADECARKYYNINKSINSKLTETPDLVASTEEEIYLDKIKSQNDNIVNLQQRAQNLQTDIDKADIITTEMNKAKLQDYIDTQKRNIDLVANKLEQDKNKITTKINIPTQALNVIINAIKNLENLSNNQKAALINKIIDNTVKANQGTMTQQQYDANLNQILKSCPQYDLTGLVPKSLVSNVCYGCDSP